MSNGQNEVNIFSLFDSSANKTILIIVGINYNTPLSKDDSNWCRMQMDAYTDC